MNNASYTIEDRLVISNKSISIADESRLEWLDARYRLSLKNDEPILSPKQFAEYKKLVKKHCSTQPNTETWKYYENVLLGSYA